MDKDKKIKYALVIGASCLFVSFSTNKEYEYHPDYEILTDSDAYAKYPDGNVYIGDLDYINSIECNPNDILVLDERSEKSNIKVIDSYKIKDRDYRNDIINIILEYENEYPSNWDRSAETMRDEWFVHNMLYGLGIRRSSTTDVDFENNEEKVYKMLFK